MFTEEQVRNIKESAEKLLLEKFKSGNDRDCELLASQILKVDPTNAKIIQLLGLLKHKQQNYDAAQSLFENLIVIEPENYENYNNLGLCLSGQGKYADAVEALKKAAELRPDLDFVHSNLGLQHRNNKNIDDAIAHFDTALSLKPTAESFSMLGGCYGELRNLKKAEECFRSAIALNPDFPGAHVDLASIHQFRGEWDKAWPEYEWRFKLYEQSRFWDVIFDPAKRLKPGIDVAGKRVLIHPEQGTGDMIHFFRYVRFLKEKKAHVILHCWESLRGLLQVGVDEIYTKEPANIPPHHERKADFGMPEHDLHCSIMSLPYVLDMKEIPRNPYIKNYELFDASPYKNVKKIGIAWAGNPQHPNDKWRSCMLREFKILHDMENTKLFSLQKDIRPRKYRFEGKAVDLTDGAENMKVIDVSNMLDDFSKTAAVIAEMDAIVTVDTAILHLAGAMGKRTIAMIAESCDWRWGLEGSSTTWYPSVTLVRKNGDDWGSAFSMAHKILRDQP